MCRGASIESAAQSRVTRPVLSHRRKSQGEVLTAFPPIQRKGFSPGSCCRGLTETRG